MLRSPLLLLSLVSISWSYGQPLGIYDAWTYQAVVRDNAGQPIPNQAIGLKIGIGNFGIIYEEEQTVMSNDCGLIDVRIGDGVPTSSFYSDYVHGQRWEVWSNSFGPPPNPPPTSGFNQFPDDLRFELIDNTAPSLGWVDLH